MSCAYCRPRGKSDSPSYSFALTDAQRVDLVRFLHEQFGLAQVRITGGEPLLHAGLADLIASLRQAAPDLMLAMTTNGALLADRAVALREAGLDRLNLSLDSLDPRQYQSITGSSIHRVLAGLEAAVEAGFPPPKINAVVLRGINDKELVALAQWAFERHSEIRFLEAMPIGPAAAANRERFVSAMTIRCILAAAFTLTPLATRPGETARRYLACKGRHQGVVGIIAPVTESFCGQCRRIRVTADGMLFPCLLDSRYSDLRPAWGGVGFCRQTARRLVMEAVSAKRPTGPRHQIVSMITLGG